MIPHLTSLTDRLVQATLHRLSFKISHHNVTVAHLPDAFEGFTIVQISDPHIDRWNRAIVEAAADAANALSPDLLVCTGDVIAESPDYLPDVTHLLRQFRARYGKLACLGNHDYSDGSGSLGVRKALHSAGFDVLVNESTCLTVNHRQVQLAGADDLILGRQCLRTTSRRLSADCPTILLSHNPENFGAMATFKPSLVLSGHTHGGQIRMPHRVYQHFSGTHYIAGFYESLASKLYVNSGLGTTVFVHHANGRRWAIPSPRVAIHPEISVFTLSAGGSGQQPSYDTPDKMAG